MRAKTQQFSSRFGSNSKLPTLRKDTEAEGDRGVPLLPSVAFFDSLVYTQFDNEEITHVIHNSCYTMEMQL